MPGASRHLRLVSARPRCASPDCCLPADRGGLCVHCTAVYKAALLLYDQLGARELARLEIDHPGFERAARNVLRAGLLEYERRAPLRTAVPRRAQRRDGDAELLVPLHSQVARLERFLEELRTLAADDEGSA